jgi:hypothetical protein
MNITKLTTITLLALTIALNASAQDLTPLDRELLARPAKASILTLDSAVELQVPLPTGGIIPTNIPQSGSFTNATVEIGVGVIVSATGVPPENVIDAHYNLGQIFFIQGEIENGPGSTVLDVVGGGVGLRKAYDTAEVYGRVEGRRNWQNPATAKPAWELEIGGGAGWMPFNTSGTAILRNAALYAELNGIVSTSANRPEMQSVAGLRYLF